MKFSTIFENQMALSELFLTSTKHDIYNLFDLVLAQYWQMFYTFNNLGKNFYFS